MEDALQNEELILKKVLYRFELIADSWMKALRKEMDIFAAWEKKAEHSHLTDEEKINAFRIERAGDANTNPNLSAAAAWAVLITSGRKSVKDIPQKKRASGLDYERVKTQGIWEDDPPELKEYFARYEEYRKERDRWNIPIPDKLFRKLGNLFDSGEIDKYLDELSNLIASWMKDQPPEVLSELFQPNEDRVKSLERMAKPWEEGGLEIPFPKKYPYGIYFLTCNTIAKLYGMRPEICGAILGRSTKGLSRIFAKLNEVQPLSEKETDLLGDQLNVYHGVINKLSEKVVWGIENFENYLNRSLKNLRRDLQKAEKDSESRDEKGISLSDLRKENEEGEKIEEEVILFTESVEYQEASLALSKKIEENVNAREILSILPQRAREIVSLILIGYSQKEIAAIMRKDVRTVQRWIQELKSNTQLHQLLKPS
jgi:DNA-directed RNA polymerase specialized sigma24 family protein